MRQIDALYLKYPFFGSRKLAAERGIKCQRAQRLLRPMGLEAHYAQPHLSRPAPGHEVYPYLLRHLTIEGPHHVRECRISAIFPCPAAFCIRSR